MCVCACVHATCVVVAYGGSLLREEEKGVCVQACVAWKLVQHPGEYRGGDFAARERVCGMIEQAGGASGVGG